MGCCGHEDSPPPPRNITLKARGCTDVVWLCIFMLFLCLMIFVAAFAFVYGNPLRLINGYDSFGNTCGTMNNEKLVNHSLSGLDMSEKPFLFYLDMKNVRHSLKVCVKLCPDRNLNDLKDLKTFYQRTGSLLCRYDYVFDEGDMNLFRNEGGNGSLPIGYCPLPPVYASDPVINRCIPRPVQDVIMHAISSLYAVLNSWDAVEQVLADLYASWREVLALSFFAFVLSLVMISFLHLLASIVAWIFMLIVSVAAIGGTSFLWYTYASIHKELNAAPKSQMLEESVRNESAFLIYSIAATAITVVLLLLVFAMRKRIRFLAQLFEDSASCLGSIPALFLQPLVTFAALLAFFAFWVAVVVCLATSNYPGVKPFYPYQELFADAQQVPTRQEPREMQFHNISLQDFKQIKFVEFVDPAWVRYFWWVYLIGLVWVSEFILACQQMVIAGAVSQWYFNGRTSEGIMPVLSSVGKLLCYHLGSIAKGSFLITLLKVPRLVLMYIHAKMKGSGDNACVRCGLKCCICCFWCFEKCIRFMNHNAYTVIAMEGESFCSAAKTAFTTLGSNALRLITLNSVGDFILFLGKCFVTAATGTVGLIFLRQDPHLHFYAIPTLAVCVFAFFIAHCVLSLYEIVIDTMFLCVCEDEKLHPEGGQWQQTGITGARQSEATELTPINVGH